MTTAAPYLDSNEYPDDPAGELALAIETLADTLYGCAGKAAEMDAHTAEWCGAEPILVRLREVVEELRNATGY